MSSEYKNEGTAENIAENESLKDQIKELEIIIKNNYRKTELIECQLAEIIQIKSFFDTQSEEIDFLKSKIQSLTNQIQGMEVISAEVEKEVTHKDDIESQLERLHQKYAHVQTLLIDLQQQITALSNRNILLQQQNNEIIELNSSFSDSAQERDTQA